MIEHIMITLTAILVIGIACQWLAWWVKLPAILFLLIAGIIAGPVTGFINPNKLFGELLFPFVSLGVAIILFEGGLTLKFHEIKGVGSVVWNLVTIGALITWSIIATATHWLLDFTWAMAFLFGALVVVTGPTVIVPLLRTVRPTANIANILRWEGIIIDPLGALFAVLVFEFILSGQQRDALQVFGSVLIVGGLSGTIGAYMLATILRRHLMPEYLHNVASLSLMLGIYTLSDYFAPESGLLAVTLMGIILANMKQVPIEDILNFKESLSVLLISILFIVLAARIEFYQFTQFGWETAALFSVIFFIARPVSVFLSTLRSKLSWRERALISWIAPRGIVAAAVSSLFALRLAELGFKEAEQLVPLTFIVIIGTVIIQSISARPLANFLKVSEPEPRGVLIVGANTVAREIAKSLQAQGFRTLLTDTSWDNIKQARMEGLSTYFGNVVSEHADRHLDLIGIGVLFAMSRRPALNALACLRYRNEFGANAVFNLQTSEEKNVAEKKTIGRHIAGTQLFGQDITHAKLASILSKGGEIRTTLLTDSFDLSSYQEKYGSHTQPLFALSKPGRLYVFTTDSEIKPETGWTITYLLLPEAVEKQEISDIQEKLAIKHNSSIDTSAT